MIAFKICQSLGQALQVLEFLIKIYEILRRILIVYILKVIAQCFSVRANMMPIG